MWEASKIESFDGLIKTENFLEDSRVLMEVIQKYLQNYIRGAERQRIPDSWTRKVLGR